MTLIRNCSRTVIAALLFPALAMASSHREAPSISNDPAADNTDLYAWVKPGTHDKLYIVANYNPLQEPGGGPNFHSLSDEVLYEIHLARGATSLNDAVTYQIRFKTAAIPRVDTANLTTSPGGGKEFFLQLAAGAGGGIPVQTYTVSKQIGTGPWVTIASNVKVAPPNIGPRTYSLVYKGQYASAETTYNDAFAGSFVTNMGTAGDEGRVFVGPRDDGFYVDLGGIFDLAGLRAKGTAQDGVAGYNVSSIALEIPTTKLTANGMAPGSVPGNDTTVGVWASASRRKVKVLHKNADDDDFGPWVQVSRIGLPLINEAMIGLQDKDKWNRAEPKDDLSKYGAYFLNPILVRDAEFAGFYATGGPLMAVNPVPLKSGRQDIIDIINLKNIPSAAAHSITSIGDVLRVDLASDSGFPNGRPIPGAAVNKEGADVTDVLLSLILTGATSGVGDGVDYNDANFLTTFPFLPKPWSGSDQGHGKPTP
jgi:hypothetical protein